MKMTNELATVEQGNPYAIMPVLDIRLATQRRQMLIDYTAALMVKGRDYGKIPYAGDKPTLLKPGAEKLTSLFGLAPHFDIIERELDFTGKDHDGEPFFFMQYRCTLYRGDMPVGQGVGSCNSWEKKYRFRKDGSKNPNPADIVNTIDKMSQKRALVAAVLIAVNASEFFTQDLEDYSDIVDGEWTPAPAKAQPKAEPPKATPPPAPMPDDEVVIMEAGAKEFVTAAAALLDSDTEAVKERLHALGYDRIPGDKGKRLEAYRLLKQGKTIQPAPVAEAVEAPLFPLNNGAYMEN